MTVTMKSQLLLIWNLFHQSFSIENVTAKPCQVSYKVMDIWIHLHQSAPALSHKTKIKLSTTTHNGNLHYLKKMSSISRRILFYSIPNSSERWRCPDQVRWQKWQIHERNRWGGRKTSQAHHLPTTGSRKMKNGHEYLRSERLNTSSGVEELVTLVLLISKAISLSKPKNAFNR